MSEFPDKLILFDGYCNLCDWSVQFILKNEAAEFYSFAPLQSDKLTEEVKENIKRYGDIDSVLVIEDGRYFIKSTGALKISRKLKFPWNLAYSFIVVPPVIRDWVYDIIANNRFNWFGKRDTCMMPEKKVDHRFIDQS